MIIPRTPSKHHVEARFKGKFFVTQLLGGSNRLISLFLRSHTHRTIQSLRISKLSHVTSETRTMPRSYKHRSITLHAGTSMHDAFFGADDSVRENFDQAAACAELCGMAADESHPVSIEGRPTQRRRRVRQNSSKAGRPVVRKYGDF